MQGAELEELTTTSYAILSLLAMRSWSAYELSQQMRRNVGEFWPRAERGIYNEPKKLVARGLARSTDATNGRRTRTIYTITPAGRRALRTWLASEPVSVPQLESEHHLRIAFCENGTTEDALRTLDALRDHAQSQRRMIEDIARSYDDGHGPYPERARIIALMTRFFADYYALTEDWADWAATEIAKWETTAART